jgi:hypothetical protein
VEGWRLIVLDTVCVCRQFVDEGFQRPDQPRASRSFSNDMHLNGAQ